MMALSILISVITKKKEADIQQAMFLDNIRINREYGYFSIFFLIIQMPSIYVFIKARR